MNRDAATYLTIHKRLAEMFTKELMGNGMDESRYWESYIIINDMRISLNIDPPKKDVYGYQQEALSRRVIYAGVTRRWYPDGWRYFATLLLDGPAPVKHYYDGELLHPLGKGKVGHDIGTQTMASCGDNNVSLYELADRVKGIDRELRILNRAMDRSSRAMNPGMFDKDGQIIPINRLPADKLTKHGKRKWVKSKRYCQLESERRSLYREQKEMRICQHNELCNKLLPEICLHLK
ncbi:MAG: hypothetical protein LUG93_09175 [Lachnospiraceae bacterium]|nr:hypothetical protein [Lachnospiraceae bacterium]